MRLDESVDDVRGVAIVAEDDRSIAELERVYLTRAGFGVHVEADGARAWDAITRLSPSIVILDVALPSIDGVEICRRMRARGDWTPVIFVTAQGDEVDRLLGLELGADDYLTKPFSPRELVARAKALLRRSRLAAATPVLTLDDIELDPVRRLVSVGDLPVELTLKEFDLLQTLLEEPGRVFTRAQLLASVWGQVEYASGRTVDVHIAQLRAKLGPHSPIRTVRGIGYAAGS